MLPSGSSATSTQLPLWLLRPLLVHRAPVSELAWTPLSNCCTRHHSFVDWPPRGPTYASPTTIGTHVPGAHLRMQFPMQLHRSVGHGDTVSATVISLRARTLRSEG